MKKLITKAKIIKALRTEPLTTGVYFRGYFESFSEKRIYAKNCPVCAVGAVLRSLSFEVWARKNELDLQTLGMTATYGRGVAETGMDIKNALKGKRYLQALSMFYEKTLGNKCRTINFVKKHFPNKLTVTLTKKGVISNG